jgi:hypothetical protein
MVKSEEHFIKYIILMLYIEEVMALRRAASTTSILINAIYLN